MTKPIKQDLGPYRKVYVAMHMDARVRALGAEPPSAKGLWWHLLAGEHTCVIPGVLHVSEVAFADSLGWSTEGFRSSFGVVFREGLVEAFPEGRLYWVPNALKYNAPASPNVVRSWGKQWRLLPQCEGLAHIWNALNDGVSKISETFGATFREACPHPFGQANPNQRAVSSEQKAERRETREALPDFSLSAFGLPRGMSLGEAISNTISVGQVCPGYRLAQVLHIEYQGKSKYSPGWTTAKTALVRLVIWVDRLDERGDESVEDCARRMVLYSARPEWADGKTSPNWLWGSNDLAKLDGRLGDLFDKSKGKTPSAYTKANGWEPDTARAGDVHHETGKTPTEGIAILRHLESNQVRGLGGAA